MMLALGLPASAQMTASLRLLGLDQKHNAVYWAEITSPSVSLPIYKTEIPDDRLWEGQIPPWLKQGFNYSALFSEQMDHIELECPNEIIPRCSGGGLSYKTDLPVVQIGKCGRAQRIEMTPEGPRCIDGGNLEHYFVEPDDSKEETDIILKKWFPNAVDGWSAQDKLAAAVFFYPDFHPFACRTNQSATDYIACADDAFGWVVQLAALVHPPPPVPEAAREQFIKASTLLKSLSPSEAARSDILEEATNELDQAIEAAPWYAVAHYNLAVADELQKRFAYAVVELKYYLLLASDQDDQDTREARDRLYRDEGELEAEQMKFRQ